MLHVLSDWLWGYDFFISYAHADGSLIEHGRPRSRYARELAAVLRIKGFTVFHDEAEFGPGDELNTATVRRVRASSKLLLIARTQAMQSPWVLKEVTEAIDAYNAVVVIDINGTYENVQGDNALRQLVGDTRLRELELIDDTDGSPSKELITKLCDSSKRARRDRRRQRVIAAVALVLLLLLITAVVFAVRESYARQDAEDRKKDSDTSRANGLLTLASAAQETGNMPLAAYRYWQAAEGFPTDDERKAASRILLAGSFHRCGTPLVHDAEVISIDVSPDGQRILAGCDNGTAYLWDSHLKGPYSFRIDSWAENVFYTEDATRVVVSAGVLGQTRIFDANSTAFLRDVGMKEPSPRTLVDVLPNDVFVWESLPAFAFGEAGSVQLTCNNAIWTSDGRNIVAADSATGNLFHCDSTNWDTRPLTSEPNHATGYVLPLAIAPDANSFYCSFAEPEKDITLEKRNIVDGKLIAKWTLRHVETILRLFIHPSGDRAVIITSSPRDGGLKTSLISLSTGSITRRLYSDAGWFEEPVQILFCDQLNLIAGFTNTSNRVDFWNDTTGDRFGEPLSHPERVTSIARHPDGIHLVTGCSDGIARVWRLPSPAIDRVGRMPRGTIMGRFHIRYRDAAVNSPATGTGLDVYLCEVKVSSFELVRRCELLAIDPMAEQIAVRIQEPAPSTHAKLAIYRRDEKVPYWTFSEPAFTSCAEFAENGSLLITGNEDGSVHVWSLLKKQHVKQLQIATGDVGMASGLVQNSVQQIRVDQGKYNYIFGDRAGRVLLWSGDFSHRPDRELQVVGYITDLATGPNGRFLAIGSDEMRSGPGHSYNVGRVTMWDVRANRQIASERLGLFDKVRVLGFANAGRALYTYPLFEWEPITFHRIGVGFQVPDGFHLWCETDGVHACSGGRYVGRLCAPTTELKITGRDLADFVMWRTGYVPDAEGRPVRMRQKEWLPLHAKFRTEVP